jgi:hypothetical protein
VQCLADQLNREVAQDVEERQARQQTNQELATLLKEPFKTFSESREGKAIRRADSYLGGVHKGEVGGVKEKGGPFTFEIITRHRDF